MEFDEQKERHRARNREYMRLRRLDAAFRQKENKQNSEYRKSNPEKMRSISKGYRARHKDEPAYIERRDRQSKESYIRLRDKIFNAYGNKCACCGETERDFFEIDHVHGGGKQHFNSHTSPIGVYREIVRAGYPTDYRILCANCNRGRQRNGDVCPHERQQAEKRVPFFLHSYRINQEVHA